MHRKPIILIHVLDKSFENEVKPNETNKKIAVQLKL